MSIGDFLHILSQAILVEITLVGRLGVRSSRKAKGGLASQSRLTNSPPRRCRASHEGRGGAEPAKSNCICLGDAYFRRMLVTARVQLRMVLELTGRKMSAENECGGVAYSVRVSTRPLRPRSARTRRRVSPSPKGGSEKGDPEKALTLK